MPRKVKIDKKHIIPCLSFVFFIGLLIAISSLIDIEFTMYIFGVITTLVIIVLNWIKGSAEFFISEWERIDNVAHLGIISIAMVGFFIIIFYFIDNHTIKIIPKNNEL